MSVVEEEIVAKLKDLTLNERDEVLRYVDELLNQRQHKKTLGEKIQTLTADIPENVWEQLPVDGSAQHAHYIYGTPKR